VCHELLPILGLASLKAWHPVNQHVLHFKHAESYSGSTLAVHLRVNWMDIEVFYASVLEVQCVWGLLVLAIATL
jgi:hypothetical protein